MVDKLFVIPIIRSDYVGKCLETMHKYNTDFRVMVVDQTIDKSAYAKYGHLAHLWMNCYRNLGFAKAVNIGSVYGYYQKYPYVIACNDDVEFINSKWWDGILETFAQDPKILACNPMSPREATWGYGRTNDNWQEWQPPEGYVADDEEKTVIVPVVNGQPVRYKEQYTQEEYDSLLTGHPRYSNGSMVDAIAGWLPVFKREFFDKVGMYDEKFWPGGGEDYDIDARAYSCSWPTVRDTCDKDYHHRLVSTSKSWAWHHWGKSKDQQQALDPKLFEGHERWNNNDELWPNGFDVWGHDSQKRPLRRDPEIHIDDL